MIPINFLEASELGFIVKNPCCCPSNSSYSAFFPQPFNFFAYSSTLSFNKSLPAQTTRMGSRSAISRLGLKGPNGFISGWSVVSPAGTDSLQNLIHQSKITEHITCEIQDVALDKITKFTHLNCKFL